MIARAKRAFPGMVMSILLSAPVVSGHALAATPPTHKAASVTQRHVALRKAPQKPAVVKMASRSFTPKLRVATVNPQHDAAPRTTSRTRVIVPAGTVGHPLIRRTSTHDGMLIDDGTLWRESGSQATWQQTGIASWYGGKHWQGHRTASGGHYDQSELTAAHATLPIGTRVKVTLHNGTRFVIVTINDRPGTRTRIIDLSRQAAAELGILNSGTAMVTLSPL
jgi:rare lipoprotein A (peptidoglycan hydrolase)